MKSGSPVDLIAIPWSFAELVGDGNAREIVPLVLSAFQKDTSGSRSRDNEGWVTNVDDASEARDMCERESREEILSLVDGGVVVIVEQSYRLIQGGKQTKVFHHHTERKKRGPQPTNAPGRRVPSSLGAAMGML